MLCQGTWLFFCVFAASVQGCFLLTGKMFVLGFRCLLSIYSIFGIFLVSLSKVWILPSVHQCIFRIRWVLWKGIWRIYFVQLVFGVCGCEFVNFCHMILLPLWQTIVVYLLIYFEPKIRIMWFVDLMCSDCILILLTCYFVARCCDSLLYLLFWIWVVWNHIDIITNWS